ncbi:MAG TPA: Ig-like domain-containing protein, partial [Fibrobacteria bacterium]|nr:Ig-like domain-containing protein [Fibrobacteria bacterium]
MNKLAHSLRRLIVLGLGILALFACQLTSTQETEQTFTFPTLKEKIVGADHLTITLKDSTEKVIDVLYSGPVDTSTSFKNLLAKNYAGGTVFIHIEAKKGATVLYNVKRTFDAARGGNLSQVVYITPDASVTIARPAPRLREGETVPLPSVTVLPATLADKSLDWVSRDPKVLQVDGATLKGLLPGSAMLVAVLRSDPLRRDSVTVDVDAKDALLRILDSLRIEPDALTLAVKGPPGRLRVRAYPTGAPEGVLWSSLAATVATVDSAGEVRAVGAGEARVVAVSKVDPTVADTLLVKVLPEQKIDSVR